MRLLKILMIISASIATSWLLYIKLTTQPTTYVCTEKTSTKTSNYLYIVLNENYPWVNLWSDFNGKLTANVSLRNTIDYNYKIKENDLMQLYKENNSSIQGEYSKVDNLLSINTADVAFKGTCSICKDYCVNNIMH